MRSRVAKFFALTSADRWLLIRAALTAIAAKLAVNAMRLPSARRAIKLIQIPRCSASPERIVWAVEATGHVMPFLRNCLVQAVAAEAMMIRAGHRCDLRIGAAKKGDEFLAHAWIERDGKILLGQFEAELYHPMAASIAGSDAVSTIS